MEFLSARYNVLAEDGDGVHYIMMLDESHSMDFYMEEESRWEVVLKAYYQFVELVQRFKPASKITLYTHDHNI